MRMLDTRLTLATFAFSVAMAMPVLAQQAAPLRPGDQQVLTPAVQPQAPPAQPPLPVAQPQAPVAPTQPPAGFQLNQLQDAQLNQVLEAWQRESGKINSFKCSFQRWEFDIAFGPADRSIPLNKNKGELSYFRPDKGSFQITEINTFQATPVPPGQQPPNPPQGNWVPQPQAIGEHWVCDGTSVYEFRHNQKQLIERPIPPQLQGQAIVDGPLPFLFGADAAKLRERYWMRIDQPTTPNPNEVWLIARPKHQAQAADYSQVDVILDRNQLLPKAMQIHLPNGSRHVYMFDIENASKNNPLAIVQGLFQRPRVPFGYKRVVEEMPLVQASLPVQPDEEAVKK